MTNRSSILGMADGPPHKRRRTHHHSRKSPKPHEVSVVVPPAPIDVSTPIIPRREKKPAGVSRKKEATFGERIGGKREDGLLDCCTDYMSDRWKPNFKSTFPLSKALERRRVLVNYIHLVKRINARKDKVEVPPKRPSVLQPQTVEDLEKEIDKCSQELNMLTHKRDENLETKKNLMAKYKALYREEDEERKKQLQQQEEQRAKASAEIERLITLISNGIIPPELLQSMSVPTATNNTQANNALTNSILQSAQQNLLNSNASNASASLDFLSQLNAAANAQQVQQTTPKQTTNNHVEARAQQTPAQKHQISTVTTTTPNRAPASMNQQHSNHLNQSNSSAASLNLFHNLSSTQNPFTLTNQPATGLLTQQSQGGLVSSQPQNLHNTSVRDQTSAINAQHLLPSSAQQQQNRASPNMQAANLLQQQINPFLTNSNAATLASVHQQQQRSQNTFQAAQNQSQLDLQNMINQWNSTQSLQNFAALLPGGMNNPQAAALLAAIQQQQQLTAAQQQLTTQQALQQSIMAKAQAAQQAQAQQKQNLLSAGLLNAASRQSPLMSSSFTANQPQQQQQMTRKTGATPLTSQQQSTQQNRLQIPQNQSMSTANLAGRSATPQFAVPNLPVASQAKAPPRAQSTRPPMNFGAQSVITSTTANPTMNLTPQQQSFQSMFQANLDTTGGAPTSSNASLQQQQQNAAQEALLQQLAGAGLDQQSLMLQMLLLAQQQQQSQLPK